MKITYLYMHHSGFDFFLCERELAPPELRCAHCGESDTLIGNYTDERALAAELRRLFAEGYDLIPCTEYASIKARYDRHAQLH